MNSISLLSPEIQNFGEGSLQCRISHQIYSEEKGGVKVPVNYNVFFNLTEKGEDGKFILPIEPEAIFGKKTIGTIHEIKGTIGHCSQIAEELFDRLKYINGEFKRIPELKEIFDSYEGKYHKLDFMGHRNLLSEIFKSKKLDWLNEILKAYDVKSTTKAFYAFIMDRNKYTHGILMFWYPNRTTLLEYENEARQTEYGIVNADILNSFIQCYKFLDELFNLISKGFDNQEGKEVTPKE